MVTALHSLSDGKCAAYCGIDHARHKYSAPTRKKYKCLHVLRVVLFVFGVIIVIIVFLLRFFLFLGLIGFLLLLLLVVAECLPLCCKFISLLNIVTDNDVVENGTALDLPQVEADEAKVVELVNCVVILIFRI